MKPSTKTSDKAALRELAARGFKDPKATLKTLKGAGIKVAMPLPFTVWTLLIEFDNGSSLTVHRTEEAAMDALWGYVEEKWPEDRAAPGDRAKAIADYFKLPEIGGTESANIQPHRVE